MYKLEGQDDQDGEPSNNNDDAYIQKYFSNGEGEKKPWSPNDDGEDSNSSGTGSPEV